MSRMGAGPFVRVLKNKGGTLYMIKLIVGTKGTGKTKTMIEHINAVTKSTAGNVVVLEKSMQLTYDIDHAARLVDLDGYGISGYEMLYGFVAGVLAGNYDIT